MEFPDKIKKNMYLFSTGPLGPVARIKLNSYKNIDNVQLACLANNCLASIVCFFRVFPCLSVFSVDHCLVE